MKWRKGDYVLLRDMDEERPRVSWRKFYVHLSEKTNDAHLPWVSRFESIGQVKVDSPEDSDYILLFCPIASRVGTDISDALESIPAGDKEVILVVMHHTFNKDHVVADSRWQVSNPKVLLIVDTLFFEGCPLQSKHNEIAWDEIKKFLGVCAEVPSRGFSDYCMAVLQLVWAVILLMITWIRRLCERCFGNMEEERPRVPWRKFYVHLSGRTNDAHLPWVSRFVGIGQVKVVSPEDSDYILLFCPIASRVGTDISEALESIPAGDKEVILVVMHHTFNRDHVVADSRWQVKDPKVRLVVDTLFFEGHLLESNLNEIAWDEIMFFFGVHPGFIQVCSRGPSDDCLKNIVIAVLIVMVVTLGITLGYLIYGGCFCFC
ncbi:uncharacterized protein LOC121521576 isoform X2 [Cheilinus undulatus]|uniref:uncharacterized protein LOC121521576 isoform X2 n=1 Tax=Cheilinus undulatus TaxID=241271 RepID=UPI001BD6506C|nr:uncharacterized protein LOC121521576 isoform X2 [Cheilinus undulatus]